jgi:ABC-type Fe3+ transport system permease subunit
MPKLIALLLFVVAAMAELAVALAPFAVRLGLLPPELLPAWPDEARLLPLAAMIAPLCALLGGLLIAPAIWPGGVWRLAPFLLPVLWPEALWPVGSVGLRLASYAAIALALGVIAGRIGLARLPDNAGRIGAMSGLSPFSTWRRLVLPATLPPILLAMLMALLVLLPELALSPPVWWPATR